MSDQPLLSIVVVCKNPGPRLRATLESIWGQNERDFELIVIDGGSSEGSLEWLKTQSERIHRLSSRPDRGVYDAMNRGIEAARGEWLLFLGADDRLASATVLSSALGALRTANEGVVAGEARYDDGRVYRFRIGANPVARNFVHHQCAFYRRRLFVEHGLYDATLAIMGDYDLNVRLKIAGVAFKAIPLHVSNCGIAGISDGGRWQVYREEISVRHRYFPAWRCWLWDLGGIVRYLRKKIVRAAARH